jgi:pSer/pThr/pTyr-binding forkhead associated (FHA) protein
MSGVFGVGDTVPIDGEVADPAEATTSAPNPESADNQASDEGVSPSKLRKEMLALQAELEALGTGVEGKPKRQAIRRRGKQIQELLTRMEQGGGKESSSDDDKTPPPSSKPTAPIPPGYKLPPWSSKPAIPFVLEVLKNGVSVEKVDIGIKEFYSFGRQEGTVDVVLAHPSVSRQHAVVQHADNGLFVYDLGSANGTFVNKQRIPKEAFQKLMVGHVIKFGESSRLYVVDGPQGLMPDEYDSARLQKLREKLKKRTENVEKRQAKEKDASYASWGFDEDAVEEEEEEGEEGGEVGGMELNEDGEPVKKSEELPEYIRLKNQKDAKKGLEGAGLGSSLEKKDVDDKDKKLFEKLQKKLQKMRNLQEEKERIWAKEYKQDGGLTAGQQQQADRNDQQLQKLQQQIEEVEDTIRQRNNQRFSTKEAQDRKKKAKEKAAREKSGKAHESDEDEDDDYEDDFFDRTGNSKKAKRQTKRAAIAAKKNAPVLTAETLERRLGSLTQRKAILETQMLENAMREDGGGGGGEVDALDAYMLQTNSDVGEQRAKAMEVEMGELKTEIEKCTTLLNIARPALTGLKAETEEEKEAKAAKAMEAAKQEEKEKAQKEAAEKASVHTSSEAEDKEAAAAARSDIWKEVAQRKSEEVSSGTAAKVPVEMGAPVKAVKAPSMGTAVKGPSMGPPSIKGPSMGPPSAAGVAPAAKADVSESEDDQVDAKMSRGQRRKRARDMREQLDERQHKSKQSKQNKTADAGASYGDKLQGGEKDFVPPKADTNALGRSKAQEDLAKKLGY